MNIKYRQLKAFALAVEAGSFRAAADRLSVTQSSFSALIKELEQDVGIALFERTTRTCRPTDAGLRLYDRVHNPLLDLEEGYAHVRDIGRGEHGLLGFGVLPSLACGMAARHVARFARSHPGIRIKLRERKHAELIDAVRHADVEFGIGVLLRPDPDVSFEYLTSDQLVFVVPDGHPLAAMTPVWKCLERFPYIYVSSGNAEHALAGAHVRAAARYDVEHVATALEMVRLGLGVSVLASSALPALNTRSLTCIPIRGDSAVRRVGIIQKKGRHLSAAARAFLAQVRGDPQATARRATRAKWAHAATA
jgi:LysR family transcriptional regulator, carnitine catabolism transcriptional activator